MLLNDPCTCHGSDLNGSFYLLCLLYLFCLEEKVGESTLDMLLRVLLSNSMSSFECEGDCQNMHFFLSLYSAMTCEKCESPSPFLSKVKWIEEFYLKYVNHPLQTDLENGSLPRDC